MDAGLRPRVNSLQVMYITFYKAIVKEIFPKMEVCQFLIGNVYPVTLKLMMQTFHRKHTSVNSLQVMYIMKQDLVRIIIFLVCSKCQFLIGNVYQLVLSVSNYDTTPFSSQNQSKIFKKSVDLQQLRLCKSLILQHSILFLNLSLTSKGFLSKNYAN